jgi:hypothetical protein
MTVSVSPRAATSFERPTDRADELQCPTGLVRFLEIPVHRFVMIDGSGAPGDASFRPRMPGLYATAYGLHFALKAHGVRERVGPLEGLWWTVEPGQGPGQVPQAEWLWTIMIELPDAASDGEVERALGAGRRRLDPELASGLRVESFDEGLVAQVVHVGPYADEQPTLERLFGAMASAGLVPHGRHHELYLGDPRRSAPDRLRTVLRQPVRTADSDR